MFRIGVDERRARLGRRHRLGPDCRAADPVEAAAALVALHATDPATVHLSVARGFRGVTSRARSVRSTTTGR